MVEPALFSSARQDWATPPAFIEWLRVEQLREFDLDAAALQTTAKAPRYFGPDHQIPANRDGLAAAWRGHVWLNPPFGREISAWLEKCAEEIKRPEVHSIIVLVPARTDTKWFHELVMPHAYLVYLIKGRFNFSCPGHVKDANAPFPNMLVVYRKHNLPDAGITVLDVPKEARGF